MKPGYKTTEFWLTLIACAVGLFLSSGAVVNDTAVQIASIVASALTALGYTVPRTGLKKIEADKEYYDEKLFFPTDDEEESIH